MHQNRTDGPPITLGHEGVGVITKVHPTAEGKGFSVGDHVGCGYIIGCCFECEGCLTHNLLCSSGKQKLQGFTADGFFAEYVVEDWQNLAKLPESMDLTKAGTCFSPPASILCLLDSTNLLCRNHRVSCSRQLRAQAWSMARSRWMWRSGTTSYAIREENGSKRYWYRYK
jgi:NADPH:quinone reductase-like Zn-dependent oxidoreductase